MWDRGGGYRGDSGDGGDSGGAQLTKSASGFDGVVCVFGAPLGSGSGFRILKFSKRQSMDTLRGSTADESDSNPASH